MNKKGFTLLELLIVIAILAILAAVTVLVINPAELLKRSRDSQRLSDLSTIKTAIGLYLTDVVTPDMDEGGGGTCGTNIWFSVADTGLTNGVFRDGEQGVDGSGWIPIDLTRISAGSPLAALPLDPVNKGADDLYYTYACATTSYEVNANLESEYYTVENNYEARDGGNAPTLYEIGTDLTLMATPTAGFYPSQ